MQLANSRAGLSEPRAQTAKLFIISPQHEVSLCSHKPRTGWGSSWVSSIHGARLEMSQQSLFFSHLDISSVQFSSVTHIRLCVTLWTAVHQAPLSMGFSRQEYWIGLPCPPPGNLLDPRIEPGSPALQADSLPLSHQGSPIWC